MSFNSCSGGARKGLTAFGVAAAFGVAMMLASSAQAATVDCDGSVESKPGAKSPRAFEYGFSCTSPQGNSENPTEVDAYSIVSTKEVIGFNANALVFDPDGEVVATGEQFQCEGPFPGFGVGCNGKMSLGNTAVSDLTLSQDPCSKRGLRTPFRIWVVVAADKISDSGSRTKTISEPFRLDMPKCPKPEKGKGKGGKR